MNPIIIFIKSAVLTTWTKNFEWGCNYNWNSDWPRIFLISQLHSKMYAILWLLCFNLCITNQGVQSNTSWFCD